MTGGFGDDPFAHFADHGGDFGHHDTGFHDDGYAVEPDHFDHGLDYSHDHLTDDSAPPVEEPADHSAYDPSAHDPSAHDPQLAEEPAGDDHPAALAAEHPGDVEPAALDANDTLPHAVDTSPFPAHLEVDVTPSDGQDWVDPGLLGAPEPGYVVSTDSPEALVAGLHEAEGADPVDSDDPAIRALALFWSN